MKWLFWIFEFSCEHLVQSTNQILDQLVKTKNSAIEALKDLQ